MEMLTLLSSSFAILSKAMRALPLKTVPIFFEELLEDNEEVESLLNRPRSELLLEDYFVSRDRHDLWFTRREEGPYPDSWATSSVSSHFIQISICLKCYARFGTFDLVDEYSSSHASKPPKLKKQRSSASKPTKPKIENWDDRTIPIANEAETCLLHYAMVCSEVVSIRNC
ncbi:hypothetical protein COLO4_18975 [Corchorus olitorius]|uniref:Uncharacterized protein n=1 Tax=Corchorus olitorius TaxID=93759 RepID=A0A1R3J788_9ROSI|nr:hypothetical protein COLO4_18975 [Corchorus olitorius]